MVNATIYKAKPVFTGLGHGKLSKFLTLHYILWAEGIPFISIVSMLTIFATFSSVQIWQLFESKEMDSQIKLPSWALSPQIILIDCWAWGDYVHYSPIIWAWFSLVLFFSNIKTLRPRQNGWHMQTRFLKSHFVEWKCSLKFVPNGPINKSVLV